VLVSNVLRLEPHSSPVFIYFESSSVVLAADISLGALSRPSLARCWWLMPIILATWEVENGSIKVWD
jgi:hypothetical protein